MELLALPTCNSNRKKTTVENDNAEATNSYIKVNEKDNMPTCRSTRVRNLPPRSIENIWGGEIVMFIDQLSLKHFI